jgi:DNA invertase Pin-like site-specific DNA recombinase
MSELKNPPRPKAYSYIRMSTEGQLQGDSLRRQTDRSRLYALEHGLDLDENTTFRDIGVSAFRGENLKQGALSLFKAAVLNKEIPHGSFLLVESLDRFSRDDVDFAVAEFLQLLRAGITIITLIDGRVFKPGQKDPMDLILSVLMLWRANNESKHKSDRLSQSWANKRAHAMDRKLTAACPAWLRLSPNKATFEVIPDRAAVIKSIFADSANGIGNYTITRRLNEKGVSSFARTTADGRTHRRGSDGWHISYVAKILNNPAVYGQFQPHRFDAAGKRVPDGAVLPDYFPVVVSEAMFMRAKHARRGRDFNDNKAPKGPKGNSFANLFSGLLTCAYCGSGMLFENKGLGPKGGTYLVCDRVKRGLDCRNSRWAYKDFEATFLLFVKELDLERILAPQPEPEDQNAITIEVLKGQLAVLRGYQEKTHQLFLQDGSEQSFVARKLSEYEAQIRQIESDLIKAQTTLAASKAATGQFDRNRDEIKTLIDRLQERTDEEIYKVRARIASSLQALVDDIWVVMGDDAMITDDGLPTDERGFIVQFKNGYCRSVHPRVPSDHEELLPTKTWHTDDVTWKPSNDELN